MNELTLFDFLPEEEAAKYRPIISAECQFHQ